MPAPRESIRRRKLGDEAARYLRNELLTGSYRPGQRLRIEELAARFGLSTMPVREALVTLANEGLLESAPHRVFTVPGVSADDIAGVFKLHARVSGVLAARAAAHSDATFRAELQELQPAVVAVHGRPRPGP